MRLRTRPAKSAATGTDGPVSTATRVVWQVAALLLAYPDERHPQRLATAAAALRTAGLPEDAHAALDRARQAQQAAIDESPTAAAQDYVSTFDLRRRRTPFLTYYTAGDTRGRGQALLAFTQTYQAAGAAPPTDELPDHLAVVLEFAATVDPVSGLDLLTSHRTSIDLLHRALVDGRSAHADVVAAVVTTLPAPTPGDVSTASRLIAHGPPTENVGLEPFFASTIPVREGAHGGMRR